MSMTKVEIMALLQKYPYIRITHNLFTKEEYIYSKEDGRIYDENGYLFEDWYSVFNCGLRMRIGDEWNSGWILLDNLQFTSSLILKAQ